MKLRAFLTIIFTSVFLTAALAAPPHSSKTKSKFYDFGEQLIDGQIKEPAGLYSDSREKARFDRLLKLKKSFMNTLFITHKEKVFK